MARTYKRDSRGRFAGGGGGKKSSGAPKSKAAQTRAANKARKEELLAKGLTASNIPQKLKFSGTAKTQAKQQQMWSKSKPASTSQFEGVRPKSTIKRKKRS